MPEETKAEIPHLPCPNCQENLLAQGFYNYCTETTSLREDNFSHVVNDRLYMDHDEKGHETMDHECGMEARCGSCDTELPWALYQLRGLDGEKLSDLPPMIAALLAEIDEEPADQTSEAASPPPIPAPETPTQEVRI